MIVSITTFEGKPCINCNKTLRYLNGKKCVYCISLRVKKYKSNNKEKRNIYARQHNINKSESSKNRTIKHLYGVTLQEYNSLLQKQNNLCSICQIKLDSSTPFLTPNTDHDHLTKKIRGLLCGYCNSGLGYFKDKKENLLNAVLYLSKEINV